MEYSLNIQRFQWSCVRSGNRTNLFEKILCSHRTHLKNDPQTFLEAITSLFLIPLY